MKLSRDTWHYRVWTRWVRDSESKKANSYKDEYQRSYPFYGDHPLDIEEELDRRKKEWSELTGVASSRLFWKEDRYRDHYVEYTLMKKGPNPNLFDYFWAVTLRQPLSELNDYLFESLLRAVIFYVLMISFVFGTLSNLLALLGWAEIRIWHEPYLMFLLGAGGFALSICAAIFLMYALEIYAVPWMNEKVHKRKQNTTTYKRSYWFVFKSFLKSKKQKICPILEFEEEDDKSSGEAEDVAASDI